MDELKADRSRLRYIIYSICCLSSAARDRTDRLKGNGSPEIRDRQPFYSRECDRFATDNAISYNIRNFNVQLVETAKVSKQGEVIIPQAMRKAYGWEEGQELIFIDTGDGILIKPNKPFPQTTLGEVAGCLKYQGTPKTIEDMDRAISQGIKEEWHGRSRY